MDGLERDLEGIASVIRLDTTQELGREIAWRYGITGVPTLLVLDGQGEMVFRQSGPPRKDKIIDAINVITTSGVNE